jgi:hypothetical protein
MDLNDLTPTGDLPPNHPLVIEALKGIISGPISELRTKVDGLITNPSATLRKGEINYSNILPQQNVVQQNHQQNIHVTNSQISSNILDQIAPVQYINSYPNVVERKQEIPVVKTAVVDDNSDQMELGLFKPAEVSDIYKKLFDIENKLDTIIKYVKINKN